jgi:hypothetical protein
MTNKFAVPVGGGKYEVQLEGNFWPPVEKNGNLVGCLMLAYPTPFQKL